MEGKHVMVSGFLFGFSLTICFNFAMPKHAQPCVGPKFTKVIAILVGLLG
jgi:hypothetical protein